ncbi:MAG: hypothetical protein Q8Q36_01645 [bacterium]|nr:hypothetical protein [bacterium]
MKAMTLEQAREQLRKFLGGRILTFTVMEYDNGEWAAQCNEIPGIITGGVGDYTERDTFMRDAIVTAAGLGSEFAGILQFEGYMAKQNLVERIFDKGGTKEAQYAI